MRPYTGEHLITLTSARSITNAIYLIILLIGVSEKPDISPVYDIIVHPSQQYANNIRSTIAILFQLVLESDFME